MKVIVLSKNDYSFTNSATGELIEGSNIYYLIGDKIEPIKLSANHSLNNYNLAEEIKEDNLPAVYDFTLKNDVKKGQLVQVVKSAKFIKNISFADFLK